MTVSGINLGSLDCVWSAAAADVTRIFVHVLALTYSSRVIHHDHYKKGVAHRDGGQADAVSFEVAKWKCQAYLTHCRVPHRMDLSSACCRTLCGACHPEQHLGACMGIQSRSVQHPPNS